MPPWNASTCELENFSMMDHLQFPSATSNRSGLPVPSRRTFALGILPSAHSKETSLSQSRLRSVSYAVSIGTGNPSRQSESRMTHV
jgi:hypothetical protein